MQGYSFLPVLPLSDLPCAGRFAFLRLHAALLLRVRRLGRRARPARDQRTRTEDERQLHAAIAG